MPRNFDHADKKQAQRDITPLFLLPMEKNERSPSPSRERESTKRKSELPDHSNEKRNKNENKKPFSDNEKNDQEVSVATKERKETSFQTAQKSWKIKLPAQIQLCGPSQEINFTRTFFERVARFYFI